MLVDDEDVGDGATRELESENRAELAPVTSVNDSSSAATQAASMTMISTHVLDRGPGSVRSPLDRLL